MHMEKCLVTLTVLFSCINTTLALDGLGTEFDPWLIKSLTDFDEFTANPDYWDDHTRLDTNINLTINGSRYLGLFGQAAEGALAETVLSQQLALVFTSAGNCFAISCNMPSTSRWTLT